MCDLFDSAIDIHQQLVCLWIACLQAVQISEASPAWQDYLEFIDGIVLNGLKQSCLTSLKSMLTQIIASNLTEVGQCKALLGPHQKLY